MKKRLVGFFLVFSLIFSLSCPVLAESAISSQTDEPIFYECDESNYEDFRLNENEQFSFEYESNGNRYTLTYSMDENGSTLLYQYENGVLTTIAKVEPGNSYYQYAKIETSDASAYLDTTNNLENIELITVPVEVTQKVNNRPVVYANRIERYIGYMHHNDPVSGLRSICCYVHEWYMPEYTMTIEGYWGTVAQFIAQMIASLSIIQSIASGFLEGLIASGVVWLSGELVQAATETDFYCYKVVQRIYGYSTTHPDRPEGDLGESYIAHGMTENNEYTGVSYYNNFTTHHWGTSKLGSAMFYQVYGMELIPTAWTE